METTRLSSSPYHRRRLSDINGYSSKNAYDDVFASPTTLRGRKVKSRVVQDYKEIFASSRTCSIPLLDISPSGGLDFDHRNSEELDYSNIFSGSREEEEDDDAGTGVCYEQIVANAFPTKAHTNTPTQMQTSR